MEEYECDPGRTSLAQQCTHFTKDLHHLQAPSKDDPVADTFCLVYMDVEVSSFF